MLGLKIYGIMQARCRTVAAFLLFLTLFTACSRHELVTTWKVPNSTLGKFSKIVVIGLVQDTSLALRRQLEHYFVADLKKLGYHAVAAAEEFGPRGLANLHQEQTYQKLCGNGIDAVLTVALLDPKKEKRYTPPRVKYYSDLYYYNRIWDYRKIQADLAASRVAPNEPAHYIWEGILFDLATLQPLYAIQSQPLEPASIESNVPKYASGMVTLLLRKKILTRQKQPKEPAVKAF
jgi:hypothetical protein